MSQKLVSLNRLVRSYILTMTTAAGSGHPSSSLSAVELMTTLMFGGWFRFDLKKPEYHNNDRLIFSKGHASPLFYSLYAAAGAVSPAELLTLRRFESRLEGHPTMRFPFTEVPTGSLGQGLSVGVGMALNAKLDKLSYRTFVLLGDSEMAEGSVWEALAVAAHYRLDNLVAIVDVNRLGQRGETMLGYDVATYAARAKAFGWQVVRVDGHSIDQISKAYTTAAKTKGRPTIILAKTKKGKGISFIENKDGWHGKTLNQEELGRALKELGAVDETLRGTIKAPLVKELPRRATTRLAEPETYNQPTATRKAYGNALARIAAGNAKVVALDAETSNSTFAETIKKKFPERFFEMYIAEQNMVGTALGLARRGKIPFVSTFGAFFTRAFDQIRMSAYAEANIKFVGSHVGVSIGEDGTSQMALEDIALFRSALHSVVLYPSDAIATERLVELAAAHQGIVYLRTTRKDTALLYNAKDTFVIGGSKVLRQSDRDVVTIVAAGITLHEALAAYDMLAEAGIPVRIIDLYSIKPIDVATLTEAARATKAIVTVEDHYEAGGIGEAVRTALAGSTTPIHSLVVRMMPRSGKPEELLAYEQIDRYAIVEKVTQIYGMAKVS